MNLQSRVLIVNLPSFAVASIAWFPSSISGSYYTRTIVDGDRYHTIAGIDLSRVIQIVWLLFNQTTVNGDENVLAVF